MLSFISVVLKGIIVFLEMLVFKLNQSIAQVINQTHNMKLHFFVNIMT